MNYGSVCSGIEAATVAWHSLGWKPSWFAEIEPFPSAVLARHYRDVPNLGDMTRIAVSVLRGEVSAPDVLVGGTPCQAFSVAGLRESLADERGNLTLRYVELANAIDHVRAALGEPPIVIVWENVPGVLSTKDNAFGCFLAGLAGEDEPLQPPGGRWANAGAVYGPLRTVAWRTLDAQYFGVAQRRRRVFVVASARDGFDPAQALFEWGGMRRDSEPSREGVHKSVGRVRGPLADGGDIFPCLLKNVETKRWLGNQEAFRGSYFVEHSGRPRFLTALEGERIQGFPDNYTDVDGASDWKRLGALGNSMAVPCMRWIGERIDDVVRRRDRMIDAC